MLCVSGPAVARILARLGLLCWFGCCLLSAKIRQLSSRVELEAIIWHPHRRTATVELRLSPPSSVSPLQTTPAAAAAAAAASKLLAFDLESERSTARSRRQQTRSVRLPWLSDSSGFVGSLARFASICNCTGPRGREAEAADSISGPSKVSLREAFEGFPDLDQK